MNDNEFITSVRKTLTEATDTVQEIVKKAAEIDAKINSGEYTQKKIDELMFEKHNVKRELEEAKKSGLNAAKAIVKAYREEIERADQLSPAEITDDVKLLSVGVPLRKRDIDGMLERNAGNRTMTQIILRYANDHNIDVEARYIDTHNHAQSVEQVNNVLGYYEKWMDRGNAYEMIGKFFPDGCLNG